MAALLRREKGGAGMKAVILAAGSGERLAPVSQHLPKALLPIGSETILSRQIGQLAAGGVEEILIVIGYEAEKVRAHVSTLPVRIPIHFIENPEYARTNTGYSASLSAPFVRGGPFLLIDGDVVAADSVFEQACAEKEKALFYEAKAISSPEEMKVCQRGPVVHLSKEIPTDQSLGEFVGIVRFDEEAGEAFFAALREEVRKNRQTYYEAAINRISVDHRFSLRPVAPGSWLEVDFVTDYLEAVKNFASRRPSPVVSEQILLCPGPVMVSPQVKSALLHSDIGHRETEFIEVLARTRQKLNQVFGVKSNQYTNVILTGSGTAANESLLSSYGPGKRLAIVTNGEFGNRLLEIARCHELEYIPIDFGWGRRVDLQRVENIIREERVDALMMVHHETSTGMLNPVDQMGDLLRRYQVDFLVDAVSSLGAEALSVEEAGITFCTASANKAIAALPGLAFVCGKKAAFAALRDVKPRTRYLDLYRHYEYEEIHSQTPNTPAVSLFFALETALDELLQDTLEKRMDDYGRLSQLVRTRLKRMGLSFVIDEVDMSRVLTTVYYPEGIDVEAFHEWIKKHNYVIYRGKGPYLGKAFQIANIGHVTEEQITAFLDLLEQGLSHHRAEIAVGEDC
jgi:2-aminoethylphosphonate-pyruvate transaminase